MDSKEAPPDYSDISGSAATSYGGAVANEGYSQAAGDYPPPGQAGYPEGYSHPPPPGGSYGPPPPAAAGYGQPSMGYYPNQQGHTAAGQQGCQQQTVVVSQPMGGASMVTQAVPDHMGLAIFTMLCCCWPLGLVAMSKASESRRALQQGNLHAAAAFSVESRRYSMWAIAGGCVSLVVVITLIVVYTSYNTY